MIELKNISKAYGKTKVIDNLSICLEENAVYCIMGASGIGKTTLCDIISGQLKPDSGSVSGNDGKKSFVFQENRLIPWLSALDNIMYVTDDKNAAKNALSATGLIDEKDKKAENLSGGMARRLAIARAMAYSGEIFFIDEPLYGLDVKTSEGILALIKEMTKDKTAFIITHSPEEAFYLADKLIFLKNSPVTDISIKSRDSFLSPVDIREYLL